MKWSIIVDDVCQDAMDYVEDVVVEYLNGVVEELGECLGVPVLLRQCIECCPSPGMELLQS